MNTTLIIVSLLTFFVGFVWGRWTIYLPYKTIPYEGDGVDPDDSNFERRTECPTREIDEKLVDLNTQLNSILDSLTIKAPIKTAELKYQRSELEKTFDQLKTCMSSGFTENMVLSRFDEYVKEDLNKTFYSAYRNQIKQCRSCFELYFKRKKEKTGGPHIY